MQPDQWAEPKVLYIAGWGRNGSTLLDRILGSLSGFVSVGELRQLWSDDHREGRLVCGCGERVNDCAFWTDVLGYALEGLEGADLDRLVRIQQHDLRLRSVIRQIGPRSATPRRQQDGTENEQLYTRVLRRCYRAVAARSEARVVVDSSKHPTQLNLIADLPDGFCVHLVRDPRAAAHSWTKRPQLVPGRSEAGNLESLRPIASSAKWVAFNAAVEVLGRRFLNGRMLQLRYEDFCADPLRWTKAIVDLVGEDTSLSPPYVADATVVVESSHSVAGNPSRFRVGEINIRLDDAWRSKLSIKNRLGATVPAAALMWRYGYPLRTHVLPSPR